MGSLVAAAQQLATRLTAAGVQATIDPAKAVNARPCVLVPPPAIDYVARANTWRLALLSSHPAGSVAALDELDELLQGVLGVLDVEAADPGAYQLTPDAGPVPAYLVRITT